MVLSEQQIAAVNALAKDDGRLEPSDVVQTARDPASPLHPLFEWDDAAAAAAHRLEQARNVIKRVRVEVTVHNVEMKIPAYLRDPHANQQAGTYRHIAHIRTSEGQRRDSMVAELRRAKDAHRRAHNIALFLGARDIAYEVDAMSRQTDAVIARVVLEQSTNTMEQ